MNGNLPAVLLVVFIAIAVLKSFCKICMIREIDEATLNSLAYSRKKNKRKWSEKHE